ncbi:DUF6274 family protein [Streptomyces sp. NBC_01341]|uniref:DUF6274 family protein n=1 Tax=Streptomyces sp. NBC_01341 TaxID=2903831 RepID=UPI002E14B900|nr:DUF6274 family protein [Streptomyces sp. NBC_01341]
MSASTGRHETRALLRAHLAAASGYRHLTRHCPICHRLLRLAMEPLTAPQEPCRPAESGTATRPPAGPESATDGRGGDTRGEAGPHHPPTEGDTPSEDPPPGRRETPPGDRRAAGA